MPRVKDVSLGLLMQKANSLHTRLAALTAEYNDIIYKVNTLKHVQEHIGAGAIVQVQGDACKVLVKRVQEDGSCTLRVLRKCNEPENAFINDIKDYQVTSTDSGGDSDEYI